LGVFSKTHLVTLISTKTLVEDSAEREFCKIFPSKYENKFSNEIKPPKRVSALFSRSPEEGHGRLKGPPHLPLASKLVEPVALPRSQQVSVGDEHGAQGRVFGLGRKTRARQKITFLCVAQS
jgi:hypothetical protein